MRILYVGHTYTIHENQRKIAEIGRAAGVELLLVTPDRWKGPLYKNKADHFVDTSFPSVRHEIVPAYLTGHESAYFFSSKIFTTVAEFQPDIIHVEQGAYAMSYAQVILAAKRSSPQSKASFFSWWNLPYTLTGFRKFVEDFNLRHSAGAIVGNNDAKEILRCKYFTRPIAVIPQLGVDAVQFTVDRDANLRVSLGLDRFTIAYFGRVSEEKGVTDLVDAVGMMATRERVEILVVGSGDALSAMTKRAAELGVRLVHQPAVRNEEIPRYLSLVDLLVLPSRTTPSWKEQFGHILIEAMAAGVPVVGSASGQIPYVIADAGRIVPESNPEALGIAIAGLVKDEKLRRTLVKRAHDRVAEEFSDEVIAGRHLAVFHNLMATGVTVGELAAQSSNGAITHARSAA